MNAVSTTQRCARILACTLLGIGVVTIVRADEADSKYVGQFNEAYPVVSPAPTFESYANPASSSFFPASA